MRDPYKDIGFDANRIGFGRRAGVVVVDFQKGFTESRFPLGGRPMVERAVNNTAQLLAAARKAGLPVASCYTAYSSARDAPLWKIPTVVNEFHHGHPCTELDERIYDRTYDMVVCKTGPSIFFNTPVATYFVKEGVDTVIVSGCNTSGCVRASINEGGYQDAPNVCGHATTVSMHASLHFLREALVAKRSGNRGKVAYRFRARSEARSRSS